MTTRVRRASGKKRKDDEAEKGLVGRSMGQIWNDGASAPFHLIALMEGGRAEEEEGDRTSYSFLLSRKSSVDRWIMIALFGIGRLC